MCFFAGTIDHVVDADTVDVAGLRVRLWGIDAPEVDEEAGRRAQAWARAHLTGRYVVCVVMDTDRWGRTVAKCGLAEEIIAAGHAVDWPRYSGGYYGSAE